MFFIRNMGFDLNFAYTWNIKSKILRKINKNIGHRNAFIMGTSIAFEIIN